MLIRCRVLTVDRMQGVGKASGKPYNLQTIGVLADLSKGQGYVEVMLNGDDPVPEVGKVYDAEVEFYSDRNKRLSMAVRGFRLPAPQAKAA